MGEKHQDIDGSKASKLYSRLCPEDLPQSISRSFTPVYILKLYSRLYTEALLPSIS
jgi:hypothetical protein